MKTYLASMAAGLAFAAMSLTPAAALPVASGLGAEMPITLVAGGCGARFHRGPYGGCQPNWGGGGPGWRGPGWRGPGWGGPGWRGGWRGRGPGWRGRGWRR